MLKIQEFEVSTVAGLIAAGVFLVHLVLPTFIPLILVGLLGKENTAATWSVIGRTLHASPWPTILRTETAGVQGVRGSVRTVALFQSFLLLLLSIASIVTPLGLYQTIIANDHPTEEPFSYVNDTSSFGFGTLPRRNDMGLSRMCWGSIRPKVCPWSNTTIIETRNSTTYTADLPIGYDVRIPKNITEIYSAGLSDFNASVSSVFDIQWRTYKKVLVDEFLQDNRSYLVGDYRHLQSIALNDRLEAIEGLIVDTRAGMVGFRNHTLPPYLPHGSTWSEDLLFIEPETQCVDLNITLDFNIPISTTSKNAENLVITDRGGFSSFSKDIPTYDSNTSWANANLRDRAYFAAWFSNVYSMFYLNITNPKRPPFSTRFQYVNSSIGSRFPISDNETIGAFRVSYDQMRTTHEFGEFLNLPDTFFNRTPISNSSSSYANPFKIYQSNFTDIATACSGSDGFNYANMSNIAVSCGMVYGAARRKDGTASLFFDPGSEWMMPLYSCASASKASIKTVEFAFNGTAGLQSLKVLGIKPKSYAKDDDKPLWGVEKLQMLLQDVNPVWGITTPEHANHPNISTARQEYLYLPGFTDSISSSPTQGSQNFAGVDFYSHSMGVAYQMTDISDNDYYGIPDYTGKSNLAMYFRWQEMSRNSSSAAKIINLIWTDIAANAVVGTKSQLPPEPLHNLGKRDEAKGGEVLVTVYTRRIRFHPVYGIPAFLVLALGCVVALACLVLVIIGRATPSSMRHALDQTSAGRLLTTFLYTNDCPPGASRANWIRLVGRKGIHLGGPYPLATDGTSGVALGSVVSALGNTHLAESNYGKTDDVGISLQSMPSPHAYSPVHGDQVNSYNYYNHGNNSINNSQYGYAPASSGGFNFRSSGYTEYRSGPVSPLLEDKR
ncbi:hypothetical protein BCR34DRAFT_111786 [Clohesyomyces aquaticus]|uniref:Uncharacterized protein n=1 Tax=Clohesyomyces aquaticus TaxID=1231657 RepID=A0A1Y1YQY1_9PLEO|nr:hypothetical protein BCR34DRAFT_111786 [Clohesyomyces aquaticus]